MKKYIVKSGILITSLACLLIILGALASKSYLQSQSEQDIKIKLSTVLETIHENYKKWITTQISNIQFWPRAPRFEFLLNDLLTVERNKSELSKYNSQAEIRNLLSAWMTTQGYLGFFIISPDGINIASSRDENLGSINIVKEQSPDLFEKLLKGQSLTTLPMVDYILMDDLSHDPNHTNKKKLTEITTMFVMIPTFDDKGNVIAIFAARLDPAGSFASLFQSGRLGLSGETYALNNKGLLISESRFVDQLRKINLLNPDHTSALNVYIRDPEVNLIKGIKPSISPARQKFTVMAQSALAGNSSSNMVEYNDYRGVKVIGTWLWDNENQIAITTEIDKEEAYATLRATLNTVYMFAAICICILIIAFRTSAVIQRRLNMVIHESNAKSSFLSSMSHELRTPLNAILGFSEMICEERLGPLNHEKYLEYVKDIHFSGKHLLSLVENVLDISRIESGQMEVNSSPIQIDSIARSAIIIATERYSRKRAAVKLNYEPNLPFVMGDQRATRQVFLNIIDNALKFSPTDSVVTINAGIDRSMMSISIVDNGIGMSEEDLNRVVEPFTQVNTNTYKAQEGAGLGLHICKELIELQGGIFNLKSKLDVGTTITFSLPLDECN